MEYILNYFSELWFLLLEMAPWLLLGLIFAGLLKVYFPQKHIDKYLGKPNFWSSLNAALLGIPMPLCSCGVIPTGISFFRNGASKGATNSFLISTPQTGVDSIFATYSMLGWPFALLRPVVAFITGVVGGLLTNFIVKEKQVPSSPFSGLKVDVGALKKYHKENCEDSSCGCKTATKTGARHSLVRVVNYAFVELLQDIARWLIIGFLIAALISVVLPNDFFTLFKGLGMIEIFVILVASVPIYICATGSIPIAAVLLMKGVSPGAALVFLMAGPATNMATITVLGKTMGKRSLFAYLISIIGGAIFFGWLTNQFLPREFILSKIIHIHGEVGHEMLPYWLQIVSAIILIGSMVFGFVLNRIQKREKINQLEGLTVTVKGMTCSHCEATVKKNLEALEGIDSVIANSKTDMVKISGKNINLDKVQNVIDRLGFQFID